MKSFAIAIAIGAFGFCVASKEPTPLRISLVMPSQSAVLGEPLKCKIIWENTDQQPIKITYGFTIANPLTKLRIVGNINKECVHEGFKPEWVPGAHATIIPTEKIERSFDLTERGIVNPGSYELWIEFDSTGLPAFWDEYGVERLKAESNHFEFRLLTPTGLDAEVFQKHKNSCNQIALTENEILTKFPTSTYAGYALVKKSPAGSLLEASVVTSEVRDLVWHVSEKATEAQKEEMRRKSREGYESFIKMAQAFLQVHPDFSQAAYLRKEMATCYFYLDKPQEAWLEVEALARLDGQCAEEGRMVLRTRNKDEKNPRAPAEPQPASEGKTGQKQPANAPAEKKGS